MITGQGATVYYTFSVDSNVKKSITNGATTNVSDTIVTYDFDTIVTGRTTNESDSFVLKGEITNIGTSSTGGPAEVSVDGEAVDLDDFEETVITLASRGTGIPLLELRNIARSWEINGYVR